MTVPLTKPPYTRGPHKTVELMPGHPEDTLGPLQTAISWWYCDVWLGPLPLIKLVLALQVAAVVGAWWR